MTETNKRERRAAIFAIAVPIIIQNIVQQVMLLTDRAFLGNLHSRYLAVIGNVMFPYNALTFFFFSMATGLVILIAQNVGAKKYEEAQNIGETSFVYSTILSSALFLIWFFGGGAIFAFFGAKGAILRDAFTFVRIFAISLIFLGVDVTSASILQGVGVTRPIMVFGILKGVLNVALDWVLIFGHLGFKPMGLQGAAYATMISSVIGSLGILITVLVIRGMPFRLSKRALLHPQWPLYWQTLRVGLPTGVEALLWQIGQLALVRLLNQVDGMAIGVYSLVGSIQGIVFIIYIGFAKAALTLVGHKHGEGDIPEARRTGIHCLRLTFIITLTSLIAFEIFPRPMAAVFTSDPKVLDRAVPLLRLSGLFIQGQALNVVTGHAIRGEGDTLWMLISQVFGTIFVVGASSFMIFGLSLGLIGMYLTMIADEYSRGIVNFFRFYRGRNPFKGWRNFGRNAAE